MDIKNLTQVGSRVVGRGLLQVKKYSPEILTAAGVVGGLATTVLASRATLRLESEIDLIKGNLDLANHDAHMEELPADEVSRARTAIYIRGSLRIAKLYAPAISIGTASVACVLAAHGIMKRRNVALIAAYNLIERGFSEYRNRVIEEFGEEKDRDYRLGLQEYETKLKGGKSYKEVGFHPAGNHSPYARIFDELNDNWVKTREYNLMFLIAQQNYANDLLRSKGHIFLNEVYDMLGFPRTQEGQVVGWAWQKEGDNYVDFDIYNLDSEEARAFVNGWEPAIILDFNVDGVVLDLI